MLEELKANILTKYLIGQCTKQEEEFIKNWLKSNETNQLFLGFLQQKIQQTEGMLVKA
jgi:hypothetical protein